MAMDCNKSYKQRFCYFDTAYEEVKHKIPECGDWLKNKNIKSHRLSPAILNQAQMIKNLLEIEEEEYNKGVNENDLLIIASAKIFGLILISNEARQNILPALKSNYNIPAVCELPQVNVRCISFIELIKQI